LKKHFSEKELFCPTLPVNPIEVIDFFINFQQEQGKPDLLLGSSLGGFYAYYTALRFAIPVVLINPSLIPWKSLAGFIGTHKRFYSEEPFEWMEKYLRALKELNKELDEYLSNHKLLHFFLATDDDVLDHSFIPEQFQGSGLIRFYEKSGHGFSRFEEIIPEIKTIQTHFKNLKYTGL